MDKQMIGKCGAYCGDCDWKEVMECPGCLGSDGKLFWGECSVAKCSIDKGINHCGHCKVLPCENLQMSFDNMEHGDNGERLQNLKNWAEGKETYITLTKLTSKKEI
jgi:hypothetical protein